MRWPIRTRLLAAFFGVAIVAAASLSAYFLTELESFGMRKLDERLSAETLLLAAAVAGQLDATGEQRIGADEVAALAERLEAAAPRLASRVRLLDADGAALIDSDAADGTGVAYGQAPEVAAALAGGSGRATRTTSDGRVALYVANPIVVGERVVGVAYASAATFSIRTLLVNYRSRIIVIVALFAVATLAATELLARRLSQPLRSLAASASAFANGDYSVRVTPRGSSETRGVAEAFNAMADEVQTVMSELREEERRKSRFVSDVSHELRTPLTAIRGAAETLLAGDVPEHDARQFLATIVRESERLARLANDLLTLERIEGATGELPLRRVLPSVIVSRAVEGLRPLLDERGVTVTVTGETPEVLGDPDRLQQVVANLLDNATRMTPRGGTVAVDLGRDGDHVTLTVADEGPGIAEDALPHVFERFYRAQPSRDRGSGGAGLGLAIVAAIARSHAGSVSVANRETGGSAFTLRLPALKP